MKYKVSDVQIGEDINGWIIVSEKYSEIRNGKRQYYINAICKVCQEIRKVGFFDILNGKSKKCQYCHNNYKHYTNDYIDCEDYVKLIIQNDKEKYEFLIDKKFEDEIKKHYWGVIAQNNNIYARASDSRSNKNSNLERLHRFICELEYGKDSISNKIIDHKNRNTFDNRLINLNIVTNLENAQNARLRKDNTSGCKGVNQMKNGKWCARIQYNKKRIVLGYFDNYDEAVKVRQEAEKKYHQYNDSLKGEYNEL